MKKDPKLPNVNVRQQYGSYWLPFDQPRGIYHDLELGKFRFQNLHVEPRDANTVKYVPKQSDDGGRNLEEETEEGGEEEDESAAALALAALAAAWEFEEAGVLGDKKEEAEEEFEITVRPEIMERRNLIR